MGTRFPAYSGPSGIATIWAHGSAADLSAAEVRYLAQHEWARPPRT